MFVPVCPVISIKNALFADTYSLAADGGTGGSGESETVVTPSDINVNHNHHQSLARFVAPRRRQRKRRTIFSPAATHVLQQEFNSNCYPDNARLLQLAQLIGHTDVAAIQVITLRPHFQLRNYPRRRMRGSGDQWHL